MSRNSSLPVTHTEAVDISSVDHEFSNITTGLYVGVAGNVVVRLENDDADQTFTALPVGWHPIRVTIVRKGGTAATNIVGVW